MATPTSVLPFVRNVWKNFLDAKGLDSFLLSNMKVVSADKGKVVLDFTVEKEHLNRLESLHGGVMGTLVDIGGSLSIASMGMKATGVTTDLNLTCLSPAKLGDVLSVEATCVRLGRTLAFTEVDLKLKEKIIAQGRHTKYVATAHKTNAGDSS
ncbi:Thioesterase/thiol ester dehydrase-isomerase [Basidiobolus meristosporus CBS 931.73]|uniref:Thioesterase/thiol ester dehydrase-isomerase n=1 Tax=Basidiobolus meristosporus CBS 931.73 TaxID=1314790 RepID=A0A1Y1VQ70_9FUNG|nr:Thioesterase/thiol ester dehydrase-isomerase [Basidiobolus meristosporus CBS 931.73]|eukprot:ORX63420.1 Thioesterase/thiol ester dehydrase-isomerase [Basidiobolus meristosporus CBS 931.73]